jgi:hypothetical protein
MSYKKGYRACKEGKGGCKPCFLLFFVGHSILLNNMLPKLLLLVSKLSLHPKWYKNNLSWVFTISFFLCLHGISGAGETERRT